jgi:histidine kinase/DNA gyrase B/HSP90-like ATPase
MTTEPRFTVAARALRQFGAELITSDEVALNELIKNAFDAKSKRVRIDINAPADAHTLLSVAEDLEQQTLPLVAAKERVSQALALGLPAKARQDLMNELFHGTPDAIEVSRRLRAVHESHFWIEVTDTGVGMSREQLQTEFLTIGTPNKWLQKQQVQDSSLLGEKGIGRLSMMRLARHAFVTSKREHDAAWHQIQFHWKLFDDATKSLEEIPIPIVRLRNSAPARDSGTTIRLFELGSVWNSEKVENFIHGYLRRLQDPFQATTRPYPIDVYFNGERQAIPSMYAWFSAAAQFKASIEFRPSLDSSAVALRRRIRWRHAQSDELREWTVQSLVSELSVTAATLNNVGAFDAKVLWFNRQLLTSDDIEHSAKEIKDELNIWCGGFAIYRDGFRIGRTGGMDDDWLQMDEKALRSQGFMLNRYQTVGSLRINSKDNPRLIDAANRESLVSCPEYEALRDIFADVIVKDLRSHISSVQIATTKATIERDAGELSLRQVEKDSVGGLRWYPYMSKKPHRWKWGDLAKK